MDEAIDIAIEADEGAEGCNLGDGAFDEIAHFEAVIDKAPRISFGLFDT